MALPAYAEAVRFYQMALQALERQAPVDEAQRCTLLLALGEAQRKAGEPLQALDTLQEAADIARSWEHRSTWLALPWSSNIRPGQRELPACASSASAGRGAAGARRGRDRTHGHGPSGVWRARSCITGLLQHAAVCAEQAVAMARRVSDPATWPPTSTSCSMCHGDQSRRRRALPTPRRCCGSPRRLATRSYSPMLTAGCSMCHLELGDIQAADVAIAAHSRLAEEARQPFYRYVNSGLPDHAGPAGWPLCRGGAPGPASASSSDSRLQVENADGVFGIQMFTPASRAGTPRRNSHPPSGTLSGNTLPRPGALAWR